jgi:hypothetical protein
MRKLLALSALGLVLIAATLTADGPRTVAAAPRSLGCPAGAYRHGAPPFCLTLPPGFAGARPSTLPLGTAGDGGIQFHSGNQVLSVWWVKASNRSVVSQWLKTPVRGASRRGDFQVLRTDRSPGRTSTLVYDATQHETLDIYYVPSVRASVVVEGKTWVVRCLATRSLDHRQRAADVVKVEAAFLNACQSLQVGG